MSKSKERNISLSEKTRTASETIKTIGLTVMTAAAVAESVGLHGNKHEKAIVNKVDPDTHIVDIQSDMKATAQRREREEHTPHYVSYNASQRTPSRTGKA